MDYVGITSAPDLTFKDSSYSDPYPANGGGPLIFPNIDATGKHNGYFGPDFQGSAAPEPSQIAALGFTAFGVLGLILRARKRKGVTA